MLRRSRRRRTAHTVELDITAFMNLMVILVPFLLITAVFSRVTILDLFLPPESSAQALSKNPFQLEIVIRKDSIQVLERGSGLQKTINEVKGQYDMKLLTEVLKALKQRYPGRKDASILSESEVSYDTLVQVMDRVRMFEVYSSGKMDFSELFPNISIGDAPETKS